MAPGLTEETPLPINGSKGNNVENGKHSITEEFQDGPAPAKKGKYNAIPGPLGLASASLEGKVALVTGAGELGFLSSRPRILGPFSIRYSPARRSSHHCVHPAQPSVRPTVADPCKARARTAVGEVRSADDCAELRRLSGQASAAHYHPPRPLAQFASDQEGDEKKKKKSKSNTKEQAEC